MTYIIHNPEPKPWGDWVVLMALVLNSSMNRFATIGLMGSHGCTMYLFKLLTFEEATGIFEAGLEQCCDVVVWTEVL